MMVTSLNLLNFLVSRGFLYPRTPAEPIESRDVGLSKKGRIQLSRSFVIHGAALEASYVQRLVVSVLLGSHVLCACWPCGCRWVSPRHEQQVNRIFPKKKITKYREGGNSQVTYAIFWFVCADHVAQAKNSQQPGIV